MAKHGSVIVLAPNSFARFLGSAIESQFQLLLRESHLATLHNLDLLFNSPLRAPRLDNGFKETNPMAGYYLESFLKLRGWNAHAIFDWNDDTELCRALEADPVAVALSTTYITDNELLATCIRALRRTVGDLPIVVGGPYIYKQKLELERDSHDPVRQRAFREFGVDALADCLFAGSGPPEVRDAIYVAHEFGERTLLRVLEKLAAGKRRPEDLADVPNLVLPVRGGWHATPEEQEPVDLEEDFTHWDLVEDMPAMVPLRASVGCPYRCRYCDFIELHPTVRMRSPDSIAREIRLAKKRSGRFFGFIDDNIFLSKKRIAQIADTMTRLELGVVWGGFFRVDRVDESNIDKILESGCRFGLCGIETGDNDQIRRMRKGCRREEAMRGIELASEGGIHLNLSLLIGYPGETQQTLDNTIEYLNRVPAENRGVVSWLAYPFYLLPNTAVDEPDYRREYDIHGRRGSWRHATMTADEAMYEWAPYMFRRVTNLPYHYYTGDVPGWWDPGKRRRAFATRRALTESFLDGAPEEKIQARFGELFGALKDDGRAGQAPHWREVLAERSRQPGQRQSYRGAFGQ